MRGPSDARIWFDGAKTSLTGRTREFTSPPLSPGREYIYRVRVEWMKDGRKVDESRSVTVHAGDRINLDFASR